MVIMGLRCVCGGLLENCMSKCESRSAWRGPQHCLPPRQRFGRRKRDNQGTNGILYQAIQFKVTAHDRLGCWWTVSPIQPIWRASIQVHIPSQGGTFYSGKRKHSASSQWWPASVHFLQLGIACTSTNQSRRDKRHLATGSCGRPNIKVCTT